MRNLEVFQNHGKICITKNVLNWRNKEKSVLKNFYKKKYNEINLQKNNLKFVKVILNFWSYFQEQDLKYTGLF